MRERAASIRINWGVVGVSALHRAFKIKILGSLLHFYDILLLCVLQKFMFPFPYAVDILSRHVHLSCLNIVLFALMALSFRCQALPPKSRDELYLYPNSVEPSCFRSMNLARIIIRIKFNFTVLATTDCIVIVQNATSKGDRKARPSGGRGEDTRTDQARGHQGFTVGLLWLFTPVWLLSDIRCMCYHSHSPSVLDLRINHPKVVRLTHE